LQKSGSMAPQAKLGALECHEAATR
jgi:hypothetical protein